MLRPHYTGEIIVGDIGPVVGTHAGRGTIGVAFNIPPDTLRPMTADEIPDHCPDSAAAATSVDVRTCLPPFLARAHRRCPRPSSPSATGWSVDSRKEAWPRCGWPPTCR